MYFVFLLAVLHCSQWGTVKMCDILKTAGHTAKRIKIWDSRVLSVCKVLLTVKASRSVRGHSVHFHFFPILTNLHLENGWL